MKKILLIIVVILCFCSCKQKEYIIETKIQKEYIDKIQYDSIFIEKEIYKESMNDTQYITINNIEYKYKYIKQIDTFYCTDTINNTLIQYIDKYKRDYRLISITLFLFLILLSLILKKIFTKTLL